MVISIIFPAYNEEKRIGKTLKHYSNFFKGDYEFIVVNDGSKDKTSDIVMSFISKDKRIKLIELEKNFGKGGAIIQGLKSAKGDVVGFTDSDDAFDIEGIKRLVDLVKNEETDCAIASKWAKRNFGKVTEPFSRKIFSKGWNYLVRLLFGLNIKDTQGGAKFFSRKVLEKINKQKFICSGFSFDVELLYHINKNKFSIKEVFVSSAHVVGSTFRLKYMFKMFIDIIKLRIKTLR